MKKRYILLAGVNGAGKSTLFQTKSELQNMLRINTDEILRQFGDWRNVDDLMKAGKIAVRRLNEYLDGGFSFNQETTLCGKSIFRTIEKARQCGYSIEMHYVGVDCVEIAKKRVAYRVEHGGHGIPEKYIERRYIESLENLPRVLRLCDLASLYDNTEYFRRFAIFRNGENVRLSHQIPLWYQNLMI